ncbi:hypothetical protein AAG906_017217 [Vitis piasezkii]
MADFSLLPLLAFGFAYGKGLQSFGSSCFEISIALPRIPNKSPQSHIALEKCHFMVHQGIVLRHIISKRGIEVDKAKVDLIVKLSSPTLVKGDAKLEWDDRRQQSFEELKQFLTTAPIVRAPN